MSLDDRMKRALLALELTAQGKAYSYAPVTAHAAPESMEPLGDADPPHLLYARRYAGCRTDAQREQVIEEAQDELKSIRKSQAKAVEEPSEAWERRLIKDGEGFDAQTVAVRMNTGVKRVWSVRKRNGRDKDTGKLPETEERLSVQARTERARVMKDRGMSARQIAVMLRVDHKTVTSDLERAA